MEVVYRALDGKIFETEEDCVYYERTQMTKIPKAINIVGKEVTNPDGMYALYLQDEKEINWLRMNGAHLEELQFDSWEEVSFGLYIWDEFNEYYQYYPTDEIENIFNFLKRVRGEK